MKKRIIDWSKYPMVIDNSGYKNTFTLLPCKCEICGKIVYKSIIVIDRTNDCYCLKCGYLKIRQKLVKKIDQSKYPMVLNWDGYENTLTKLPCKCDSCGITVYKSINRLDQQKSCYCKKCGRLKAKQTMLDKYGVEHASQLEEFKEKTKQTNLERYGVEHTMQCEEVQEKSKQTMLDRYGVENAFQSEEFKKKIKQTNLEKYGKEYPSQREEVKEKFRQTNKERYGAENPFQSKKIQDKIKQTNVERYGSEYHMQTNRESWQIEITSSVEKFEEYLQSFEEKPTTGELFKLLGYKNISSIEVLLKKWNLYQYVDQYRSTPEKEVDEFIQSLGFQTEHKLIGRMEIDIFIPEKNIAFEYNGTYWHSEERGKDKYYHKKKQLRALKHNITLYHISELDWINKQKEVKSLIRNVLCIDNTIEREIRKINESIIITDNGTTINELYEKHGFVKVRDIEPDYTYVYKNEEYSKLPETKSKFMVLFGHEIDLYMDMSEDQMVETINRNTTHKILKIWDCGKTEWKKILK